jgi:hypothetical protein
MAGDRGHVDEVPGFLLLHVRQRRSDAVQHALDVDVDHPVPFVDLEAFERRLRHQAGVVDHDVDAAVGLDRCIHQVLDLVALDHIGPDGECLTAAPVQLVCQCPDTVVTTRTERYGCASCGKKAGGRFPQSAACACDDDNLSFDVIGHDVELIYDIARR